MARIVVIGAGIGGTAAALLLARDGHQVTVLERDPDPPPPTMEESWTGWKRQAVGQFRLPHYLLTRGSQILRSELPDVADQLLANGALQANLVTDGLSRIEGAEARPDDERFTTITGRRPMVEWVFANTLAHEPGVTVRRGAAIDGLIADDSSGPVPHVVGVELTSGEAVPADVVVDSSGRKSATPAWLAAIGAQPPVELSEDSGFTYYGRFFRSDDGSVPPHRAPALSAVGSISLLCLPSDNGTWSAVIATAADDAPLRRCRQLEAFERVFGAFPAHAHWLEGEPISDVELISGTLDRQRIFAVDGRPVVTGLLTIGDAWTCTNPTLGRGISMALSHAVLLRDAISHGTDDAEALALRFAEQTEAVLGPWRDTTLETDRARAVAMRAYAAGTEPDPPSPMAVALSAASRVDADALRLVGELQGMLALPNELFARDGVAQHLLAVAAEAEAPIIPGPDRAALLDLVS